MKIVERQQVAQKRAQRIRKMYAELQEQQPLATKTAILHHIAKNEGVTYMTALRAIQQ